MGGDARAQRLRGMRVTLVTGSDEHGEKIAVAAAKAGLQPKEHCDAIVASYRSLWDKVLNSHAGRVALGAQSGLFEHSTEAFTS